MDERANANDYRITGAGRGMGADFAKAALASGHAVVATGRNTGAASKALGTSNDLLPVKLDVTNRAHGRVGLTPKGRGDGRDGTRVV